MTGHDGGRQLPLESVAAIAEALNRVDGYVTVKDGALRYVLVNDRILAHWGLARADVMGRRREEIFPSVHHALNEAYDQELLAYGEGQERYEACIPAPPASGRAPVWVRGIKMLIRGPDGRRDHVLSIGFDVTDLKAARDAIAESAARDAATVAAALDAIIVVDEEGRVAEFNAAAERIFGWTKAEMLGQALDERIIPDRHRGPHRAAMARLAGGGPPRILGKRVETEALGADGREIPVELAIVRVARDGAAAYTAFLRDLTERRAAETRALRAERDRAQLSRFFPAEVVEEMLALDRPLSTTRSQEAAVMFADMVGFTTLSSEIPAEGVIALLRAWHGAIGAEVFRHGGTLDKFLGDGLMATFGSPRPRADDAAAALRCAMDMIRAVGGLNQTRAAAGQPPLALAVGVHHGPVVVGDLGGEGRLELTVVGDTVNVASRIEGLCRRLETPLVATREALARAADAGGGDLAAWFEDVGAQAVRGRREPVELFRLRACPSGPPGAW